MSEMTERIREKTEKAERILVGIGEKFGSAKEPETIRRAYEGLAALLKGKDYFIITLCGDDRILEAGLAQDRIVRPLAAEEAQTGAAEGKTGERPSMWSAYMDWLQGTLHRKLLVLEFGVGLTCPNLIRFPFEKAVFYNQKAELIRVHASLSQLPVELNGRGISVATDATALLAGDDRAEV